MVPLEVEHLDRVLQLTLNRPDKRNALNLELRTRLTEALDEAVDDPEVGAVLIAAAGDHFCAGFDLGEVLAAPDPTAVFDEATAYHRRVHTFPKPMVAAVAGSALAGGFDLALLCDLRLAAPDARFGQPQVRQGIPALFDLLANAIGDPRARELCLTGRIIEADEAQRIGLVHRVVESAELLDTALELAADIAALPASMTAKQRFVAEQPDLFGPLRG
jgi:enoyl-CoA hydratase